MVDPSPQRIEVFCPAKVNLALSVGPPGADGLHPIASWMAALDFGDTLTLEKAGEFHSRFHISFNPAGPCGGAKVDWPLEKDLVYRAVSAVEARAGQPLPVNVALAKSIPAGAGLGGGSSDAAGALAGMNDLFELGLQEPAMQSLARQLGSDVVFLLAAQHGALGAMVSGLGEKIAPLRRTSLIHLTLIFPPFGCPTGPVYRAWDQRFAEGLAGQLDEARVRTLAAMDSIPDDGPFNDLWEPACRVQPALPQLAQAIGKLLQKPVHLSGSGSTLFCLAADREHARDAAGRVTSSLGLPALAASTLSPGTVLRNHVAART
jgi:4-diphosphocytidyl-2-C-methyl-D-erythritol kinase